ncbi:hypothetical protein Taro_019542 [Colocasia esculenta]|uniref:O-fucosyltransferase family protein n=1 Tax=Colocasia esculenta TaxID=4460 RepID=A0A843UZI2_COLES|nr:hypothetical protein [Colocasia esculenta]
MQTSRLDGRRIRAGFAVPRHKTRRATPPVAGLLDLVPGVAPVLVRKETLLDQEDLKQFQNHSSQMAALDYMVSIASDVFIPTYDGNMAKVVEGHRRYLGFRKSILLDRKKIVELLDLHQNQTIPWDEFANAVRVAHANRTGQPSLRRVIPDKPKEEDYFYSNPVECLCNPGECNHDNASAIR